MRSPIIFSLISSLVLLAGCDDQSASQDCRYYVQQDLDNEQFDSAIAKLESSSCQDSYPDNEYLIEQAFAYLGKSGYSFISILSVALEDQNNSTNDSFTTFASQISSLKNDGSLAAIEASGNLFTEYLGLTCGEVTDPNETQKSICLTQGVIDLTKAALAIDYLSGDIEAWIANESDTMSLSTCALRYSADYAANPAITIPYVCDSSVSVISSEEVTFTTPDSINKSYQNIEVTNGTETQYYLQSIAAESIVFTNNFCEVDFTACTDINESTCYVCPSQDENDLSVNEFVIDSLNSGIGSIENLIIDPILDNNDAEIQDAIDDFKAEIGGCETDIDSSASCYTIDDIVSYLNN